MVWIGTNWPLLKDSVTVNYVTEIFPFVTDGTNLTFKNVSPYYRRIT
jgi:hypothetical protein